MHTTFEKQLGGLLHKINTIKSEILLIKYLTEELDVLKPIIR